MLLENRVNGKLTCNEGMFASFHKALAEYSFATFNKECKVDLDENLNALGRIFDIANNKSNLPVAFATNSMYVMVRNGQYIQGIREIIEGDLLPRAMEKSEHLHAEGIAQLAYSLAQTEIWDEKAWALIRE
jgi:hypothetical protein